MPIKSDKYRIHPIPISTNETFPRANLHWLLPVPSDQKIRVGHYAWYIEGPGDNYLVDTGVPAEMLIARHFKSTDIQTVEAGLEKLGLAIDDIDYVIITHSHYDHTANLYKFANTKVIIQQAELEQIKHPFAYTKPRLPKNFTKLFDGIDFEVVNGDTKIDNKLELILTPGHSAGGQSVAVKTETGTAVITGWCCTQENFTPPSEFVEKGFPFTIGTSHTNPGELYDSTKRIIELADLILPCHEYDSLVDRTVI